MRQVLLLLVLALAVWPQMAHAYLDPATGGILLQILFGGVAAVAVFLRLFWKDLKSRLVSLKRLGRRAESIGPNEFDQDR